DPRRLPETDPARALPPGGAAALALPPGGAAALALPPGGAAALALPPGGAAALVPGAFAEVRITGAAPHHLIGELVALSAPPPAPGRRPTSMAPPAGTGAPASPRRARIPVAAV
ncbi:MAG: hypothetical protein ACYDAD_05150, partial [Acidimicrobiales bacterium]